jgi:NhaP-type Na+/H+ or K+/H+ antiporter
VSALRLMQTTTAFALTLMVLGYAVVSGLVHRWYVAPALIFTALGAALGPEALGVIDVEGEDADAFTILAQVALTVILFNQASRLNVRTVLHRGHLTVRLLAIGIPVTIMLGALTTIVLLPVLPLWEAVCLAIIVAPTEVALVGAVLDDRRVPDQIRNSLSAESGFYDGFALAALLAALAVASENRDPQPGRWAWFAVRTEFLSIGVGVVIGAIAAWVIVRSRARGWMSPTWAQLATLALALISFGVGEKLHASGFVVAFTAGLAFAAVSAMMGDTTESTQVSDAIGELLELLVFAMFGAFAIVVAWREINWQVIVFAVVVLFVVRIVAVLIAMLRAGVPLKDTVFMGWFGPRGIGTLVLGLLVVDKGDIQHGPLLAQAVVVTVTISLVLHSITAPLALRLPARSPAVL